MSIPNCTLTTAIFELSRFNPHSRTLEQSINNIRSLLYVPCYLVIFGDSLTIPEVRKIRDEIDPSQLITLYREINIEDIWTFQYIEKIRENRSKFWPTRDQRTCSESHALVCNKFDFVLEIMNSNPFKTTKFGWIDAHMEKICEDFNPSKLLYVLDNITDKFHIQILNVVDKKYKEDKYKNEYYHQYRWLVCGCLFTCSKEYGIPILNRLKQNFVKTTEMGYGHAEEMLYLEILDEFWDDIVRGYGDYGQILNNIIDLSKNIKYVYYIMKSYQNMKYYKELYDCSSYFLKQIDNRQLWLEDPEMHFDIMYCCFISSFYSYPKKTKEIAEKIKNICTNNPILKKIYDKNIEKFNNQLDYHKFALSFSTLS